MECGDAISPLVVGLTKIISAIDIKGGFQGITLQGDAIIPGRIAVKRADIKCLVDITPLQGRKQEDKAEKAAVFDHKP
jgi:hypothetical protein